MIIGVSSCVEILDAPHHSVFDKYLDYVFDGLCAMPLMIPCMGLRDQNQAQRIARYRNMVKRLDGVLLTGSPTNVEPGHYGEADISVNEQGCPDQAAIDRDRDHTTLPLIQACIEEAVPLLGICRGMQEINVALGGTLYQALPSAEQIDTHRVKITGVFQEKYIESHSVTFAENGWLSQAARELGCEERALYVNSLHRQAIKQPADGVIVEAVSDDGIIEAIRAERQGCQIFAVQWHPEWNYDTNLPNQLVRNIFKQLCEQKPVNELH
ncbi:MAG: gamma-glutamyl-gamma-aminobutyrate hydrolase family protein [Sedimenticola sp.]